MEPGWWLQVRDDPSQRRGIWTRETPRFSTVVQSFGPIERLEICAGREGDDVYVDLRVGDVITEHLLHQIYAALSCGRSPEICYEENDCVEE